jgi:Flp pilus assembly protein TadD
MHATNVFLHAGGTAFLFLFLRRLTGAVWRSALAAALFALHPLHVEPVVWISSRKDVLSTFFGFASLWFYARHARGKFAVGDYALSLSFFACALMSKTMVVTFPLLLLLLDWWPLQRVSRFKVQGSSWGRLAFEKIPFFAMAVVAGLLTMRAERQVGALAAFTSVTPAVRVGNVVTSYLTYLRQTCWPTGLSVFYPYPGRLALEWVALSVLLLAAVLAVCWRCRRGLPFLLFGWVWYVISLLPVSGLIQVGAHARADRYTYVPLVGIFIAAVWWLGWLVERRPVLRKLAVVFAALVLVACVLVTEKQLAHWRDSEAIFSHASAVTENNFVACNNLGVCLAQKGRGDDARRLYESALKFNPGFAPALGNLGSFYMSRSNYSEAIACYERALVQETNNPKTRCNLGIALLEGGKPEQAVSQFTQALAQDSELAVAQKGLARALVQLGFFGDAVPYFRAALQLEPADADTHNQLGIALRKLGQPDDAIAEFREAARLKPDDAGALNNLAFALEIQGHRTDAISFYQAGLRAKPNDAELHCNLANAFIQAGQLDDAIAQFRLALQLRPDSADAHCNYGVALKLKGRTDAAVAQWHEAIRLNPAHAMAHNNLGKTFAERGQLEDAARHFQESLRASPDFVLAHFNLADVLIRLGRREEAVRELNETLRLKPDSAEAQKKLRELTAPAP